MTPSVFDPGRGALLVALAVAVASSAPFTSSAHAMDGFELIGFGVRQKALAGAGVADSRDAMAMSLNPAGVAGLGRGFQIGLAAMLPQRGYRTQGAPLVLAPGDVRSGRDIFPMGNIAYVAPVDAESSWGVTSYSHGGIDTDFPADGLRPLAGPSLGGAFGGGHAGMNYQRQFFSLAYARKWGALSVGVAPTVAVQFFNTQGLQRLAPLSENPLAFTNKGDNWSVGGGVRVGLQYEATPALRVAVAGATPMFMTSLRSYAGLIAEQGALDVPAHVTAGVAYDVTPDITAMLDWKRIFYGQEPALANASFPIMPGGPGSANGPGFGARDIDAEAVGLEWRATPDLTLRIGYRHTSLPFGGRDVTLNVLAPGLTEHHASGGFNYRLTKNSSIDFAFIHGFENSISGYETTPFALIGGVPVPPQINYGARISPWERISEVSVGYNYAFDAGDTALPPTHF